MSVNTTMMRASWGASPPEWIQVLAEECDRASQAKAAARLHVSAAMVNQALRNSYKGRLDRLEERVKGEFMNEKVTCPVVGEISTRECLDNQARPFATTNHVRVALFRACRSCPNNRGRKEGS
jgi:hypothetical protein